MHNITIIDGADNGAIARWLFEKLNAAMAADPGPVAITVPGGSTPFPIFDALANMPIDWSRLVVWPGDDRVVPESHEASNTGRIRAILEPLGATVVSLETGEKVPHFALAWLGMGADGHIASLFPSADPQANDPLPVRRLTPDPLPPEAPFDRITLTMPALLDCDEMMFVIRGDEKRRLFEAAMAGKHDLPIGRLLAAARQSVTCFS